MSFIFTTSFANQITCLGRTSMVLIFVWGDIIKRGLKGHFTLWPRAVTMKLWGPLKLIQRPYHGNFKLNFVWSWDFQVHCKVIHDQQSTECYFVIILFMWAFYIVSYNKSMIVRFWSAMVFQVVDPPLWGRLCAKSSRSWNIINCMPCRTPCRFFIHSFNFLGPVGPQNFSASIVGRSQPFPPIWEFNFQ
jgi:hypothetical protein